MLLKESKNDSKDIEEALYCFDQALEQKPTDQDLLYSVLIGRAKANLLIGQFGKTKDDCLQARQLRQTEQLYAVLVRSRIFVEKFEEALEFCAEGAKAFPESATIKALQSRAQDEARKEQKRVEEVSTMKALAQDKKYLVYKNLRAKKIKLGKQVHYLPEIVDLAITEDAEGLLHFPVLLLYDEYMATDFVQDWREDQTLKEQLQLVLAERAPWDEEGKYSMGSVEVYFEADSTAPLDPKDKARDKATRKYVRCAMEQTLLEVL